MKTSNQKVISISLFSLITTSILFSIGGLIFGLINESNNNYISIETDVKQNDYGLIKALQNGNKINALLIQEQGKIFFSKTHVDNFSIYILDQALMYTSLPHKKISLYDNYEIDYQLSSNKKEISYVFKLYYQKINKHYNFEFLIKIK